MVSEDGYRDANATSLQALLQAVRDTNERSLRLLLQAVKDNHHLDHLRKKHVVFLLDTDREIGKEAESPEARVGISPQQAGQLLQTCAELGLELTLYVVKGAGELAGFSDADYEQAGCKLVAMDALSALPMKPDVVHALKEPAAHEGKIPGAFLRIGALHLVTFNEHHGVYDLLQAKNFSSVLDGSALGNCSYLASGVRPTPVVASMSVIAGYIAADKVLNLYQDPQQLAGGRVVIVGAGVAGMSAARTLNGQYAEIILLETNGQLIERLRDQGLGFAVADTSRIEICENTQANLVHALHGAVGLIIASRSGVDQAAHVVNLEQIESLAPGAVVVDIAIDQGGSIENPTIAPTDDLVAKMQKYRAAIEARGKVYFAEQNMPRILPREASIAHGTAILPYLSSLLVLCAIYGGASEVTSMLLSRQEHVFSGKALLPAEYQRDYMEMMMQDLRNGMILATEDGKLEIVNAEIANMKDLDLVGKLERAWALPHSGA